MTPNEILNEFIDDFRNTPHSDIFYGSWPSDSKYVRLDSGAFSCVFMMKDHPEYALKCFAHDREKYNGTWDGWLPYARWVMENNIDQLYDHAPRIYDIVIDLERGRYFSIMEKLESGFSYREEHFVFDYGSDYRMESLLVDYSSSMGKFAKRLDFEFGDKVERFDLHPGNFMARKVGNKITPVFIDPIGFGYTPTEKDIRDGLTKFMQG